MVSALILFPRFFVTVTLWTTAFMWVIVEIDLCDCFCIERASSVNSYGRYELDPKI
jgi:hypothetical protein